MDAKTPNLQGFSLEHPALIVRWKLKNRTLPLQNRHLRALSERMVNGGQVSSQLVAWAKQHIEWTLESGAIDHPNGVLMLVVDMDGQAVMSTGPHMELEVSSADELAKRAEASRSDLLGGGVAPEVLWAYANDVLVCGAHEDDIPSGMTSLVLDLAQTLKLEVRFSENLAQEVLDGHEFEEVFLSSDEHGIVIPTNADYKIAKRMDDLVSKLF